MTTDADVRTWAKAAGVDCPTRGMVPKAVRDQYDAAHPSAEHGYAEAEAAPTRPQTAADVPPLPPAGRFPKLGRGGPARPRREHKRVSLESGAEWAWRILGNAAASRGLVPTGRALMLQAPVAGMILEDTLRGTVVDRIAQPFVRGGESAKEVVTLLGVPVIVTTLTIRPELQGQLVPVLRNMMREWAIIAGPRIKAREKREKRAMEQLGVDDAGLDEMVDAWVASLFAPMDDVPEAADGA